MRKKLTILFLALLIPTLVFAFTYDWEIDYMEYANDAAAQAAYVSSASFRSNADIDDEDMADISDWADQDGENGVSSQVTFDSKSCMKLDSGTAKASSFARRQQDIGSLGTNFVVSCNFYFDKLGPYASNNGKMLFKVDNGTIVLGVIFSNDGLRIRDASSDVLIDGTAITEDTWQEWTFAVNGTAKTVDVYIDGVLTYEDIDCARAGATNGLIDFIQYGYITSDCITYIDWFKAGSVGVLPLQSYSESTIKTQGTYSLKGVAAITDSLNDTLTRTIADNLDLSNSEGIEYDIYALRTGSNIKIGIHDSGGTTSEHTANVATSNTNQTESWDISGVSDANKDDIDSIIVTISNADAANTFYLDDIKWGIDAVAGGGNWTWVQ